MNRVKTVSRVNKASIANRAIRLNRAIKENKAKIIKAKVVGKVVVDPLVPQVLLVLLFIRASPREDSSNSNRNCRIRTTGQNRTQVQGSTVTQRLWRSRCRNMMIMIMKSGMRRIIP